MAGHANPMVHYGWDIAAVDRYMSNTITSSQAFWDVETQCRIYCTTLIDLFIRNNYLLNNMSYILIYIIYRKYVLKYVLYNNYLILIIYYVFL